MFKSAILALKSSIPNLQKHLYEKKMNVYYHFDPIKSLYFEFSTLLLRN